MRIMRLILLTSTLSMPGLASAGHGAPLAVPAPFLPPARLDQVALAAAIKNGIASCNKWQVSFERNGYLETLLQNRSLRIQVGFLYDSRQVRMIYLDNHGFHYQVDENGTVFVHRKLNVWLKRLDECVRSGVNGGSLPTTPEPDDAASDNQPDDKQPQ